MSTSASDNPEHVHQDQDQDQDQATGIDPEALLRELATSEALLPQAPAPEGEPEADPEAMRLPVIEHDGGQYIPVFTSEDALTTAGVDPATALRIPLAQLAATLPAEQNLGLAVNPASQDGLALPPEVVQALPGFA